MNESEIDDLIRKGISDGVFPGACYAFGKTGGKAFSGAVGRYTYCPESPPVQLDTLWDLASVSKVVATTTMAMMFYEAGSLRLEQPVSEILPDFGQNGKGGVTIHNLLVHDSGLVAFRPYHLTKTTPEQVWAAVCEEPLTYPTGSKMIYSDLSMITLQKVLEKLGGSSEDLFLAKHVWPKLEMGETLYNPGIGNPRCSPTENVEPWRTYLRQLRLGWKEADKLAYVHVEAPQFPDAAHWIQGEVHDPTATVLGGVAGHAGLFATVGDLTRFARFMLAKGRGILQESTVEFFTRRDSDRSTRAIGWDTRSRTGYTSAGNLFGPKSYGHTGYTGTCIWIDPDAGMYSILLTNRVHPTSENTKIGDFRPVFNELAVQKAQ
jgi:CubicO group peptidase (beta-lactamase class C family)